MKYSNAISHIWLRLVGSTDSQICQVFINQNTNGQWDTAAQLREVMMNTFPPRFFKFCYLLCCLRGKSTRWHAVLQNRQFLHCLYNNILITFITNTLHFKYLEQQKKARHTYYNQPLINQVQKPWNCHYCFISADTQVQSDCNCTTLVLRKCHCTQ